MRCGEQRLVRLHTCACSRPTSFPCCNISWFPPHTSPMKSPEFQDQANLGNFASIFLSFEITVYIGKLKAVRSPAVIKLFEIILPSMPQIYLNISPIKHPTEIVGSMEHTDLRKLPHCVQRTSLSC